MGTLFSLFLFAYLCGSIPFGKIIALKRGVDIQKRGSGNIGFANVQRVLGWKDGLLTLAGDIGKGALPTVIGLYYFNYTVAFLLGLTAIAGHVFCIWLRFTGGKGIATGLGTVAVLSPLAAALGTLLYIALRSLRFKSSTASIAGVLGVASLAVILQPAAWW